MTSLTVLGWAVVHSFWQATLIGGLTALVLGLLHQGHARTRGMVAGTGLALMAIAPIVTAVAGVDFLGPSVRSPLTRAIDSTIALSTLLDWRAFVVRAAAIVWLVGVVVSALRLAADWRRAQALRARALLDAGRDVREAVADLRARMAVDTDVDVWSSARASVPMVLGWRRPVILVPLSALRALRTDQLRAVLAHELAHVTRGDYLANLCQMAADTLLFYHPAAWWLSRRIRTEREYCCDDAAVAVGGDAGSYARALATLDDARGETRLAVAAASGTLLDRVQRIVGCPRPTLTPGRGAAALLLTAVVASLMMAFAMAIPPSVPLDAKLRQRLPAPPGLTVVPPPGSLRLPRKSQR